MYQHLIRIRNTDFAFVGTDRRDHDGGTSEQVHALILVTTIRVVIIAIMITAMISFMVDARILYIIRATSVN